MANKRANGDGSLRRKANGHWEIQIMDGFKADGRRNIVSFSGKNQKEAKDKRDEYLRKKAAGLLNGQNLRFNDWAERWFDRHKDYIKPTTQEHYRYTLRILVDHFGKRKLSEIKAMDIEEFLMKLRRDGRSDSSLAHCRGMLYQIFQKAAANDLIVKNPVAFAEKMRKGPKTAKEAFTADEVRILLRELPEDKIGWSIRLMLCTGMRTQELLALELRHIAQDGSSIVIEQAVVMEKGTGVIGTPKSYDSYRTIPVPEIARYCARNLRATDKKFIWEVGKVDQPCNPSHFRTQFRKALEQIKGVRVLTPHCCRHTYVSQLVALGVDLKTIQSIVGHADVDMTLYYAHAQESSRQDAVDRFSEAFTKKGRGTFGNVVDYRKSS